MARTGAPIPSDIGGAWFSDERLQAASFGGVPAQAPVSVRGTARATRESPSRIPQAKSPRCTPFRLGSPGCDSRSLPGGRRDAGTSGLLVPRTRCLDRNPRIRGGPRSSRGLGLPPGDAGVRRLPRHRGRLERARPRRPRVRVGSAVRAVPRPRRIPRRQYRREPHLQSGAGLASRTGPLLRPVPSNPNGFRATSGSPARPGAHPARGGKPHDERLFRTPSPERTISCTDCHDPHRAEGSVAERSRTVCRECHQDPAALHDYERVTAASDCLACHLPRQEEVFPGAAFTDHRIRVQGAPPAPGSEAERSEMEYLELLYRNELAGPSDLQEEARLLVGLGELLFAQGLRTSAVKTLERGLEAGPDYQRLLKAAGLLRATGQPAPARTALERAGAMQPEVAQAFFDLGDLLLAEGDAGEAVAALERARELDRSSAVVASRLGAAYRAADRFDEALREGRAAVALDDSSLEIWLELGLTRWWRRELRRPTRRSARLTSWIRTRRRCLTPWRACSRSTRFRGAGHRRSETAGGAARGLRGVPGAGVARSTGGGVRHRRGLRVGHQDGRTRGFPGRSRRGGDSRAGDPGAARPLPGGTGLEEPGSEAVAARTARDRLRSRALRGSAVRGFAPLRGTVPV